MTQPTPEERITSLQIQREQIDRELYELTNSVTDDHTLPPEPPSVDPLAQAAAFRELADQLEAQADQDPQPDVPPSLQSADEAGQLIDPLTGRPLTFDE